MPPFGIPGFFGTFVSPADLAKLATVPSGAALAFYNVPVLIDLTVAGFHTIVPPMPGFQLLGPSLTAWITAKDGTVTTGPTMSAGCNATADDYCPAALNTTTATQALGTRVASLVNSVAPIAVASMDLSAFGFRIRVVTPSVLGTATVHRVKAINLLGIVPLLYP